MKTVVLSLAIGFLVCLAVPNTAQAYKDSQGVERSPTTASEAVEGWHQGDKSGAIIFVVLVAGAVMLIVGCIKK